MKPLQYVLAAVFVLSLAILSGKFASAQPQPQYYGPGGGMITGYVLGFDMFDQLQPVEWATVYANNGENVFTSYTGGGGYYEMYVPIGFYNVTVVEPGYVPYSISIAVNNGSASTINFYLEESHVPVPEFPTGIASIISIITLSAALMALKRSQRNRRKASN